jgi:hypothetical protein
LPHRSWLAGRWGSCTRRLRRCCAEVAQVSLQRSCIEGPQRGLYISTRRIRPLQAPFQEALGIEPDLGRRLELVDQLRPAGSQKHHALAPLCVIPAAEVHVRAVRTVEPYDVDNELVPPPERLSQALCIAGTASAVPGISAGAPGSVKSCWTSMVSRAAFAQSGRCSSLPFSLRCRRTLAILVSVPSQTVRRDAGQPPTQRIPGTSRPRNE